MSSDPLEFDDQQQSQPAEDKETTPSENIIESVTDSHLQYDQPEKYILPDGEHDQDVELELNIYSDLPAHMKDSAEKVIIPATTTDCYSKILDKMPNFSLEGESSKKWVDTLSESVSNIPEDTEETQKTDMVVSPKHYQLFPEFNLEIKDINKRILDNMEESSFDITLYEAGWYQQSMQYFERFYLKNGIEDLKKGIQTMQFVIDSMEQRKKE